MKTIAEYLQKGHIINNIDLTDLFVHSDKINQLNYKDYIKFRDYKNRKFMYITYEDLLNTDFDDIFKALQKMFLEYTPIVYVCSPIKFSNCDFVAFCTISLMTKEVNEFIHGNNVIEIVKYFKNKK